MLHLAEFSLKTSQWTTESVGIMLILLQIMS